MHTRRYYSVISNSDSLTWNSECTFGTTMLRESSLTDEFISECVTNPDGSESISIVDPVYMLFNQQRLDKLGSGALQHLLDSLQPKSDSLAELRSRCSDDELLKLIKSRHLQSPAEILAWCRYMQSNIDQFNKEVQALVVAQKPSEQPSEHPLTTE